MKYSVVDLSEAVSPLGDVQLVNGSYHLTYQGKMRKWQRFIGYAQLVQVLAACLEKHLPLMRVLLKVASDMGIPHFFPSTRYLEWTSCCDEGLESIYPFIPPSITHLTLRLQSLPPASFEQLCKYLTSTVTTLFVLQVDLPNEIQLPTQSMELFISLLRFYSATLISVCVPTALNTRFVAVALSKCPNLRKLTVGFTPDLLGDITASRDMLGSVIPSSLEFLVKNSHALRHKEDSKCTIREFEFSGTQRDLYVVYFRKLKFTGLTSFNWVMTQGMEIERVVGTLMTECPQLSRLKLDDSGMFYPSKEVPVILGSVIQLLIRWTTLTSLSIHSGKIDMTHAELRDLLRSRDTWEVFEVYSADPITLSAIFEYAMPCSQLWKLGTHINIEDTLQLPANFHALQSLTRLDIAYSNIDSKFNEMIARFLYSASEKPVCVEGHDRDVCIAIKMRIGDLYEEDQRRTGRPMADTVRSYIDDAEYERRMIGKEDVVTARAAIMAEDDVNSDDEPETDEDSDFSETEDKY